MPLSPAQRVDYDAKRQLAARAHTQNVDEAFGDILDRGPENPERRELCEGSLRFFCETYGGEAFRLAWSAAHRRAIERIEAAVANGAMFAFAMPRGSGKTTLSRWGVLWAVACGHSPYVVLISATQNAAERQLRNLKTTLRFNEILFADFPELCAPARHLKGEARRATGQKFRGEATLIEWSKAQIVLATIPTPYAKCGGSIIDVTGITGDVRGRQFERPDGKIVRPTLAIVDDPQTRATARSLADCATIEATLSGDIKFLAGPDRPLGVVMPCTVIQQGDVADRMLDRDIHPEWRGERTKFLTALPNRLDLWEKYGEIRSRSMSADGDGSEATTFYSLHRAEMDDGAEATWPERFFADRGEISAIQRAMNEYLRDAAAFFSEYQNDPRPSSTSDVDAPTAEQVAARFSGRQPGLVPAETAHLTSGIDIHDGVLFWTVSAFDSAFGGQVVSYGTMPRQPRAHFTLAAAPRTLADDFPSLSTDEAIAAGLDQLLGELLSREWQIEGGGIQRIGRCLIDAGYKPGVVETVCRRSQHAAILLPGRGLGIDAVRKPIREYRRKPGDRFQPETDARWYIPRSENREISAVRFDANYWKSVLKSRLSVPTGGASGLWLFGRSSVDHRLYSQHLTAETPSRHTANGRTVEVWENPSRKDNHWLDTTVGCLVGASIDGCRLPGHQPPPAKEKKRRKLSEMRRGRR